MTTAGEVPGGLQSAEQKWFGRLHRRLASGQFAVTAEIVPPRGATLSGIRRRARQLKDWIDAANITDGQSAVVRMASWAGCVGLMREGVEPVMQLSCRDRNRIALQADLMGASAIGINNVLCLTGDHPRFGDHPEAKSVFDMDSVQLAWLARTMRDKGEMLNGRELSVKPNWFIGCVENPFAPPLQFRAERVGKKIAAGAQFIQTQFCFDVPIFARWMAQVRDLGLDQRCSILAGVGPIRSPNALQFMQELPGVYIPDDLIKRLRGAENMEAEAMAWCSETIQQLHEIPGVSGVHIIASGWDEFIPEVLTRAGIGNRKPFEDEVAPRDNHHEANATPPVSVSSSASGGQS
ncbi:MAG TPA: methylenetetrahydrofolate reductase [Dehalococcoidia bacterium]|nr:methylenetetrahydrofolate reductase [Dehalococcoidia bacterium]